MLPNIRSLTACPKRQRGSAAIEFIATFSLLLIMAYGLIAYSIPLLLKATYEEIAAQGLQEALELEFGGDGNVDAIVMSHNWVPNHWRQPCYASGFLHRNPDNSISVCLRLSDPESIIPVINLFGLKIPSLPNEIRGEARIQLYQPTSAEES